MQPPSLLREFQRRLRGRPPGAPARDGKTGGHGQKDSEKGGGTIALNFCRAPANEYPHRRGATRRAPPGRLEGGSCGGCMPQLRRRLCQLIKDGSALQPAWSARRSRAAHLAPPPTVVADDRRHAQSCCRTARSTDCWSAPVGARRLATPHSHHAASLEEHRRLRSNPSLARGRGRSTTSAPARRHAGCTAKRRPSSAASHKSRRLEGLLPNRPSCPHPRPLRRRGVRACNLSQRSCRHSRYVLPAATTGRSRACGTAEQASQAGGAGSSLDGHTPVRAMRDRPTRPPPESATWIPCPAAPFQDRCRQRASIAFPGVRLRRGSEIVGYTPRAAFLINPAANNQTPNDDVYAPGRLRLARNRLPVLAEVGHRDRHTAACRGSAKPLRAGPPARFAQRAAGRRIQR